MTQKLKQFLEVYKPRAKGEQDFVDKHVTIKHKDRNGNGDDVFKATNIKTVEREGERHGHSSGNDEKVYEDTQIAEGQKPYVSMSGTEAHVIGNDGKVVKTFTKKEHGHDYKNKAIAHFQLNYDEYFKRGGKRRVSEDVDQIDELSTNTLDSYRKKSVASSNSMLDGERKLKKDASETKFINRNNGISRASDRLTKEEVEALEEIKTSTLKSYVRKADKEKYNYDPDSHKARKRDTGIFKANATIQNRKDDDTVAKKFGLKKKVYESVLEKYMPEISELEAMTEEEKIIATVDHLSEAHIHMILDLYNDLSEDNKIKFIDVLATPEGINSVLDLAIQNSRGE